MKCLISRYHWRLLVLLPLLMLPSVVACTSAETEQAQVEQESNLKVISVLYGQYRGRHRGKPPADEAAFRKFLETEGSSTLESFGKASIDNLFVSERDQLPYVLIYGGATPPTTAEGMQVIAHEQQGIEGKILAANDLGAVTEIEAAQLQK